MPSTPPTAVLLRDGQFRTVLGEGIKDATRAEVRRISMLLLSDHRAYVAAGAGALRGEGAHAGFERLEPGHPEYDDTVVSFQATPPPMVAVQGSSGDHAIRQQAHSDSTRHPNL